MPNIDRYQVKQLLGQGAMGKVFLAHDPKAQRDVAIKVLTVDRQDRDLCERFGLEMRAIAALKHPNIIELYEASGPDTEQLYFTMEYVPGASLYGLQGKYGPMAEGTALCIAHEIAGALMHAHEHHVVHRDIKPENVLLHEGRVILTDFGTVKAVAEGNALGVNTIRSRTRVLGTPGFMAPEQFSGHKIDVRTDIFALGAMLYNLTTGHVPYQGGTVEGIWRNLRNGVYVDPRDHHVELSPPFCGLVASCIAPKPRQRYANAAALQRAIKDLLVLHGILDVREHLRTYERDPKAAFKAAVLPEALRSQGPRRVASRSWSGVLMAVVAALALTAGGAWYFLNVLPH